MTIPTSCKDDLVPYIIQRAFAPWTLFLSLLLKVGSPFLLFADMLSALKSQLLNYLVICQFHFLILLRWTFIISMERIVNSCTIRRVP